MATDTSRHQRAGGCNADCVGACVPVCRGRAARSSVGASWALTRHESVRVWLVGVVSGLLLAALGGAGVLQSSFGVFFMMGAAIALHCCWMHLAKGRCASCGTVRREP